MSTRPNSFTARLLRDAGIAEGMRVLDFGCGTGEMTRLVADMVGPKGEVVGVDRDDSRLRTALERTDARQYPHVRYVHGDITRPLADMGLFDVAVGRRVLMYVKDPVATLREIEKLLKPSGFVVCQESDPTLLLGRQQRYPLHDQALQWIWQTIEREGGNLGMGVTLPAVMDKAGLAVEHARTEALLEGQGTDVPLHERVRMMLPRIVAQGVDTAAHVDIETLRQRLAEERPQDAAVVSDVAQAAWARRR